MSMESEVLAIGPYGPEVADCLDFPVDHYDGVPIGHIVVSHHFQCAGRAASGTLAFALGVKPTDFSTHNVRRDNIDWATLYREWDADEVDKVKRLVDAGHSLIFLPNY